MLLIAAGVVAVLVVAGVAGFLLLRTRGPADGASVTDPAPPAASSRPSSESSTSTGPLTATTRTSPTTSATSGGSGTGAPNGSTVSSAVGTTPFVPTATGATADCSAPDGVDAAGVTQTYEPGKALDGRPETAWRCSGDAAGRTITISFGTPLQLTSVGLVPGFDKIDPTDGSDRFAQSRKVQRVRWTFDDGTSVESNPNGQRGLQTTPVSVRTSTVKMTIEQTTPGTTITNNKGESFGPVDTTSVSEIAFTAVR